MKNALIIDELFKIYKEKIDGGCAFDDFLPIGEALLNDFEDIDRKNKNAQGIFKNVAELSVISKPDYLTEDEIAVIKKFFNFKEEKIATMQDKLYEIYEAFKEKNPAPDYGEIEEVLDYEEVFDEEKNITFIQCMSNSAQINYALNRKETGAIILCDEKLLPAIPAELQVLTMSEAQNKNFDEILFLSVNDGVIPKTEPKPSFIPQFLRKYFELETLEDENKRERKIFYRLFNGAKNVSFCYADMSCFLLQLSLLSPYKDKIKKITLSGDIQNNFGKKEILIEKTAEMLNKLKEKYSQKFLSPSAFNNYIDCPLQFYFKYVAGLKKPEGAELNFAVLGKVFHKTMQLIYESGEISDYENLIERAFVEEFFQSPKSKNEYGGEEFIYFKVVSRMVKNMLEYDKKNAGFEILGLEQEYFFERDGIKIGGIIDRIDKIGDKIRIIDYKTGKIPGKSDFAKNMSDVFSSKRPPKANYQFQIYLYSLILSENEKYKTDVISPNLLFVLQSDSQAINFDNFPKEEFGKLFIDKLRELFNREIPFTQCKNEKNCEYCDYVEICGR